MKSNEFLINLFNKQLNFTIEEYTPRLFLETKFKWIAFLLPGSIYGFFTIESLKNNYEILLYFLPYLLLSFSIMTIGIYLLWHYGLKKYEAYG